MIANMATFDIEKFKAQRQKNYYQMMRSLALSQIEEAREGIDHF